MPDVQRDVKFKFKYTLRLLEHGEGFSYGERLLIELLFILSFLFQFHRAQEQHESFLSRGFESAVGATPRSRPHFRRDFPSLGPTRC